MRLRTGYSELILCGLVWGSIGVIAKRVDVSSSTLAFTRVAIGAAVVGLFTLLRGRRRTLALGASRGLLALWGVTLAAHWLLMFEAFKRLDVSTTILIVFTGPVFVALGAPRALGERLERRTVISLAVSLAGLALITLQGARRLDGAGVAAAIASALLFSVLILTGKRLTRDYPAPTLVFWQTTIAAGVLLPFVVASGAPGVVRAAPGLLVLGIVHTGLTGILYMRALREVKAQHVGIIVYLEPASAIVYAWLFLSETPNAATLIGGALILAAGANVVLGSRAPKASPEIPIPPPETQARPA